MNKHSYKCRREQHGGRTTTTQLRPANAGTNIPATDNHHDRVARISVGSLMAFLQTSLVKSLSLSPIQIDRCACVLLCMASPPGGRVTDQATGAISFTSFLPPHQSGREPEVEGGRSSGDFVVSWIRMSISRSVSPSHFPPFHVCNHPDGQMGVSQSPAR